MYDEDLLPGQTKDDDDMLGRIDVVLEGELTIENPIHKWFTLKDLGKVNESCRGHCIYKCPTPT